MDKLIMTIKSKWDFALFLISTFLWQPHEIYCFKSQHSPNKIRWFFLNCYIVTHWKVLLFLSCLEAFFCEPTFPCLLKEIFQKINLAFTQLMSPQSLNVSPFSTLMSLYDCPCVKVFQVLSGRKFLAHAWLCPLLSRWLLWWWFFAIPGGLV